MPGRIFRRRWSVRSHLFSLVAVIVVIGVAASIVGVTREYKDARATAKADAQVLLSAAESTANSNEITSLMAQIAQQDGIRAMDVPGCREALGPYSGFGDYGYVVLLTATAAPVCSSLPDDPLAGVAPSDFDSSAWFDQVVATRAMVTSDVVRDPLSGDLVQVSAIPVLDDDGELRGVLSAAISVTGLELARPLEGREDSEVVLLDAARSIVIGHSAEESPWVGRDVSGSSFVTAQGPGLMTGDLLVGLDGVPRYYAETVVEPHGWHLYVGVDEETALAKARLSAERSVKWMLAILGLLSVLTLLIHRRIVRPVSALVSTIERARSGDRTARAAVFGPAELAELADEYNTMADVGAENEVQLAHQLSFVNAVAGSIGEGVYATDLQDRVTFVNPAALAMCEWDSADGVLGRTAHEVFHPLCSDGTQRPIRDCRVCRGAALEHSERIDDDVVVTRSGRLIPVSSTAAPIITSEGVVGAVVSFEDVTQRREFEAQLTHQALHDPLTGLPNRMLFLDRLSQSLARCGRGRHQVAVLFMDVDRFKVVNDSLGHETGDRYLEELAERLRSSVRPGDTVSRFGGDEFTVLCDGVAGIEEAVDIATRLMTVVGEPFQADSAELKATTSVGIAVGSSSDVDAGSLLRDADAAMYHAKESGRDRCEVFDDDMRRRVVERLEVESDLRRALERGELALVYQPIVDLATHRTQGVEALIRWHHPDRGLVSPADFVGIAEESGLIVPVGSWVIEEAVRQLRRWSDERPDHELFMSVNLSARQLGQRALIDTVRRTLQHHGVEPARLHLEITETALVENYDFSADALAELREIGVSISIDDFGTGYSSLSYLGRLPVDVVKIDGSFISGLPGGDNNAAIVTAVISLAHALGLIVVGEGVETVEQATALAELGCDLAQGFHYMRPVHGSVVPSLLGRPLPVLPASARALVAAVS